MFDWGSLLRKPEFWTAVALLVKTVLFYVLPSFPKEIWAAVDAILVIIIGTLTANRVATKFEVNK
jgi:hypothetical protein